MAQEFETSAEQQTEQERTSILIVEDEPLIAAYIDDVLKESGFHVVGIASSGEEAILVASGVHADIALIDIKLSGPMDGIEVAKAIVEQFGAKIVFLSGVRDQFTLERARRVNPTGFLQKPFKPSQVFNVLDSARRQIVAKP